MDTSALPGMWDEYRRVTLQSRKVGAMQQIAGEFFEDSLAFTSSKDHFFDTLMLRLTAEVLSEHLVTAEEQPRLEVPASWWQHLKQDHAPSWFKERWPVKTVTLHADVHFESWRNYPEADVILPRERYGRPYIVETLRVSPWKAPDGKPWHDA